MYDIQLFGRVEVRTRGVRLSGRDFGGIKPRHILALLALRGPLAKSELTELLWDGHPPANHKATVESYVSVLRRRLDPSGGTRESAVATRSGGGYELVADKVRVDVARFDQLVAAATGRTATGALRPLTAAAHLAGRPLLEEENRSDWAAEAREQYRSRLIGTLLNAGRHALTSGSADIALALAERAVGLDPMAERGWLITMAAYRALGDRVAALRAYDRCRRELTAGLGVQPSAETRALFLDLLRADGAGTVVDDAVSALLIAARSPYAQGGAGALLRRAAELV
jgi:DNA-binding SARP family transcriptional activator